MANKKGTIANLKPFTGGDDPRRGKGGRTKRDYWITAYLVEFGQLSPSQLAERMELLAKQARKLPKVDMPIFAIIAGRTLLALADDPEAKLLSVVLDRVEGKVVEQLDVEGDMRVHIEGLDRTLEKVYGSKRS